jgi:phosphoglycolate phosphatase
VVKFRAVLFDLDGTLLDTIEDLGDSMNTVLAGFGLPPHGYDKYKVYVGDGVETLARRALPENRRDEQTVRKTVALMREEYAKRWEAKTRPYDGIPELLDGLTKLHVAMAVLSNKPDDFTKLIVGRFFAKWKFDAVQGLEPGGRKKPDPSGAVRISEKMNIKPPDFAYLGDTNTDMQTAIAAGMFPVGALWGFRSRQELKTSGAKLLIAKPVELLKLFK